LEQGRAASTPSDGDDGGARSESLNVEYSKPELGNLKTSMSGKVTRRGFGASAAALAVPAPTAQASTSRVAGSQRGVDYHSFPKGFLWGCATAAYQIEGAVAEDGRKPSTWDTFSHTPGKVANNDTGDRATDSYHRYKEDVQLLKTLGVKTYRLSISWPRVFPDGTGQANENGIAYYDRVIDELLKNGIEPYVTLFHWDLPQALQDRVGGWQSRETAEAFAQYASFVAGRLGDRVHHFFTMNEFFCFTDQGYGSGDKAPGLKLGEADLNQVRHNALLGHGLGVQAIRAAGKPGMKVGLAENSSICVPAIETPEHIQAARQAMRELNAQFLTAVLEGRYLDSYLQKAGPNAPKFTGADMRVIGSPLDFVGLNVYQPTYIAAEPSGKGFKQPQPPASYPHMASPWLTVGPEAAYWAPRHLAEIWKVKEVYITENGTSSSDIPDSEGRVYDTDRIMFLRNYLANASRATAEGWPLKGYFLWSLMDNFEWADGYTLRFGLYQVDFETQKRSPKLSAEYYRHVIARNAAV
jgi:beta-glucosidase